jgi:large subunit ribosomal protein L21
MFAIVDIAGQQFKVEKDQKLYVHRLEGEAGADIFLNKVLLIDNDKNVIVGNPVISDAAISVKILSHVKGDKVIIFKKRRRKAYQILKGHRQFLTEIQVSEILEKGGIKAMQEAPAKKAVKDTSKKEEVKVTPEKKEATKSEKTAGKTKEKVKTASEKKTSESKAGKSKSSGAPKASTPASEKASKKKAGTTQKASSKKTDKSRKK